MEADAFWRVTEGGPGLPPESTPWDSAMPVWRQDLTDEQKWKAVIAAYDLAGVEPRKPEKLEGFGPAAVWAQAKPGERDFTLGAYKFRTTGSGEPPTDEDLFRIVTRGVPGTAMSGWTTLSAEER